VERGKVHLEPTGPYSNYLRAFAAEHEVQVYEVNPKRSANVAKTLGNRSKTDAIDAKMLYSFHLLLKESEFSIPEMDEIAEQLGAFIGS
jgi:transposase